MNVTNKIWYQEYLCCPDCRSEVSLSDQRVTCTQCQYSAELASPTELKPNQPIALQTQLSRTIANPSELLDGIDNSPPEVTYDGPSAIRDSGALLSQMHKYLGSSGRVLDLGCGPRDQAAPVKHLGYQYVGVDYSNSHADILADAHAIPFQDNTFDCVLSYAVLEHLHNPFIAITEIERVLKPGGVYVGTVSQGEPFHDSYFHHTAWGLLSVVSSMPNLQVKKIWPSEDTIASLAVMGRYPKVIKRILNLIDTLHNRVPYLAPRKMKWSEKEKRLDQLHRAGGICFVVKKEP